MKLWLLILTLVSGCGYFESHDETEPSAVSELEEVKLRARAVKDEYLATADQATFWPDPMDCDGVLWAGVARAAGIKQVKIELADNPDGSIGRRAVGYPICWDGADKGSKSSTSGDMAQGRALAFWRDRDLGAAQRFASYGEAHQIDLFGLPAWILGAPYPEEAGRVVLKPAMVGLVGRVIEALSNGDDLRSYRLTPSVFSAGGEDYQKALAVRGIVFFGEVDGSLGRGDQEAPGRKPELPPVETYQLSIDGEMYKVLEQLASEAPEDPLFQAAFARYSGNYAPAYRVLLGEMKCPSYTRGNKANCLANWLFAASLIVGSVEDY